ncbi:uncharacterized protein LJ206_005447 [Theristicus caerulescens]
MLYFLHQIYSRIAATLVVLFYAGMKNADYILCINTKWKRAPGLRIVTDHFHASRVCNKWNRNIVQRLLCETPLPLLSGRALCSVLLWPALKTMENITDIGSVPVVNIPMDGVQVPYPSLEVPRHQRHGRTPLEVEACVLMSACDDDEQTMTQTAAPDEQM